MHRLEEVRLRPEPSVQERLWELGSAPLQNVTSLAQVLRRSEIQFHHLRCLDPELEGTEDLVAEEVETRIKYEGYISRQERQVERSRHMESVLLPRDLNYNAVYGLTREAVEKLGRVKPLSLGQASRISGITPAAIMALQVHLKRLRVMPTVQEAVVHG